ncbi:MAG: cupin domain-containing protein [Betaproteobacteria bacterium]
MSSPMPKPPADRPYSVKQNTVIAECGEMRVLDITLAPGECVPWHLHPGTADYVICLRGEVEIREINPDRVTTLRALDRYVVAEKQPHTNVNASAADCQFLVVQGPGKVEFRPLPKLDARG